MSFKVVTRNLDSKGFETVYVQYTLNGIQKRFPTGVKVKAGGMEDGLLVKCAGAAWKEHNAGIDAGNDSIKTVSSELSRIVRRYTEDNGGKPSPDVLEELWKAPKDAKGAAGSKVTFWSLFNDYEASQKAKISGGRGHNSYRALNPLRTLLMEFEQAHGIKLTLASFDFALLNRFNDFMLQKGHTNSTTKTRISILKAMLNHFVKVGYSKHVAFREYRRERKHRDTPVNQRIVALNKEELNEMIKLELNDKHLRYTRDLFLLSCATGLRYSDVIRVSRDMIENNSIRITTEKTNEELVIPLNSLSSMILGEYPQGMARVQLPDYNERLLKVAKLCPSLHKPFTQVALSGLKAVVKAKNGEEKALKWQHITSHVGRKTFVTISLINNIPEFKIRKWTGHKSLESFARYVDNEVGEVEAMSKFEI